MKIYKCDECGVELEDVPLHIINMEVTSNKEQDKKEGLVCYEITSNIRRCGLGDSRTGHKDVDICNACIVVLIEKWIAEQK